MPPKVRITKEEIIGTCLALVRENGADALNARSIAAALGCSTQPIFSNFSSMEELQAGGSIVIFPEGARCPDGKIHDAMPGIGLILSKLIGVPVQPLRIEGAYDCLPIHSSKLRFRPITLSVGDPIQFTPEELKAKAGTQSFETAFVSSVKEE